MLGAQQKATWKRPAQDIKCVPGWPCPQTLAEKAQAEAMKEGEKLRSQNIEEQIWRGAFEPKATSPEEAIKQIRTFMDSIKAHGDYDLRLRHQADNPCFSLYSPHASLPEHLGVSWDYYNQHGILKSQEYGYLRKFFPDIKIAPHGYQIFAFLLCDLVFGHPRMNAEAVVSRLKSVQKYAKTVPEFGDFTDYNNAVISWAKDLNLSRAAFEKRLENLSLMLEAWNGVPWPHKFFRSFLPAPRVSLPPFQGTYTYSDPNIALTNYFPISVEDIQEDIATYLLTVEDEFSSHFDILLTEKLKKLEDKIKKKEESMEIIQYGFLVVSLVGMMVGAPSVYMFITNTIPKLAFNYAALLDLTDTQRKSAQEIFALLEFTQENLDTLRLWITERAELKPVLPPAPSGDGKYALWLNEEFIGRSDKIEELVSYAVAAGEVGDKVELGDEEAGETAGVGVLTADGIEWMPESVAGKFQNLTGSERSDIANSLTSPRGEFPWWLIGVPVAALIVST